MGDLSPADWALVIRAVATAPELADELRPLIAGAFGRDTRRLVLRCFAARLGGGLSARGALVAALADALRIAGADHDDL